MTKIHDCDDVPIWINRAHIKTVYRAKGTLTWLVVTFIDGTILRVADTPANRTALDLGTTP